MKRELRVALVGQPNCGKSTLFTAVSGYYVVSSNFSGTTVTFTETRVNYKGNRIRLIDLPGTYSINSYDEAERLARDKILSEDIDLIINVIDSTMLARSLELTVQLIEMKKPMVVALNMMDEAEKKGVIIDFEKFYQLTGIKAFPITAVKGVGISELFDYVVQFDYKNFSPILPVYDRDVEECISGIEERFPESILRKYPENNRRFFIIRALEKDEHFERLIGIEDLEFLNFIRKRRLELAELHNWPEESVFASHRHAYVLDISEKISSVRSRGGKNFLNDLDRFLINPIGGVISLSAVFGLIFFFTFLLGDTLSTLIEGPLDSLKDTILRYFDGIIKILLGGLMDGIQGGVGIVLPYLIPLILFLAILEDSGVLPRVAFMLDGIMHRFGLHGKAIIPFLLGYGCNVPAIMAARTLENSRDKKIVILLSSFIPCSARTVVILALVTKYLGWMPTLALYFFNVLIIFILSTIISRLKRVESEGFIMDVPPLRIPYIRALIKKLWFRLEEFFLFAWPVIIVSSLILSLLDHYGVSTLINQYLRPLTASVLGLPDTLGISLFLGIFRKELSLLMIYQALGTENVISVLSLSQIWILTVFITFYIPCIATISTTYKEGGIRLTTFSILLNFSVAVILSFIFKIGFSIFGL
ncbi:MAG: ferrous iron transport protein B [Myxococcota bacterium]